MPEGNGDSLGESWAQTAKRGSALVVSLWRGERAAAEAACRRRAHYCFVDTVLTQTGYVKK